MIFPLVTQGQAHESTPSSEKLIQELLPECRFEVEEIRKPRSLGGAMTDSWESDRAWSNFVNAVKRCGVSDTEHTRLTAAITGYHGTLCILTITGRMQEGSARKFYEGQYPLDITNVASTEVNGGNFQIKFKTPITLHQWEDIFDLYRCAFAGRTEERNKLVFDLAIECNNRAAAKEIEQEFAQLSAVLTALPGLPSVPSETSGLPSNRFRTD